MRHIDLITALRRPFVIVRRVHNDAGLKQVGLVDAAKEVEKV